MPTAYGLGYTSATGAEILAKDTVKEPIRLKMFQAPSSVADRKKIWPLI